jgi:hypothetical protein
MFATPIIILYRITRLHASKQKYGFTVTLNNNIIF